MNDNRKIALMNIVHYKNFEDYASQWHGDFTKEDFKEQIENGFMYEITLGTYNGATQTTQYRELTDRNILDAILTDLSESDLYNCFGEFEYDLKTDDDYIRFYTEFFKVFTLNGRIYIDKD